LRPTLDLQQLSRFSPSVTSALLLSCRSTQPLHLLAAAAQKKNVHAAVAAVAVRSQAKSSDRF
jgi:hypothetical protein